MDQSTHTAKNTSPDTPLANRPGENLVHPEIGQMTARDIAELVTTLESHKTELEIQNEELRLSQIDLIEARNRYSALYDFAPIGFLTIDPEGSILESNICFAEILGIERDLLPGQHLSDFFHSDCKEKLYLFLAQSANSINPRSCELRVRESADASVRGVAVKWVRIDSKSRNDSFDEYNRIDLSVCDITEQKRDQQLLKQQAYYDTLTELPNRKLFANRFEQHLAHLQRSNHHGALLYIDIDNFKLVNDSLGHPSGDRVLEHVASVLRLNTRKEDTAARFGGDEFVVLLVELDPDRDIAALEAKAIADKICQALTQPWRLDGIDLRVEVSIGIVIIPDGSCSVDEIVSHADITMYQAKNSGKNAIAFYHPGMQGHVHKLLELQQDLRRALDQQQFVLSYQPCINQNNQIVGAECLLRWQHPSRGIVMPDDFIPVLEENRSLMLNVGDWVLTQACRQLVRWAQTGGPISQLNLAVNVSPRQFNHHGFVEHVLGVIESTGANPALLTLEITENTLLKNVSVIVDNMIRLKAIGITFSIDDFGTGYSSLSYIKRLPLDTLKIDQSFVQNIDKDHDNDMLVETMIAMAEHMKLKVIAEGVETHSEYKLLIDKGCQCFQGKFFSAPLPAIEFEMLLGSGLNRRQHNGNGTGRRFD